MSEQIGASLPWLADSWADEEAAVERLRGMGGPNLPELPKFKLNLLRAGVLKTLALLLSLI